MSAHNLEQSISALKAHVTNNPRDHEALHDLAVLLGQAGHLNEALSFAKQVTSLSPTFAEGWLNLGNLEALTGDKESAVESLRSACASAPNDPRAWFNFGNLLAQTDRIQASITAFTKAQDLAPREPSVLASLALAYRRHGQIPRAIETYQAALALQPNNTWVHSNLLVSRQYNTGETDQSLFQAHKDWGTQHCPTNDLPDSKRTDSEKALRVGYVSGDFRKHPIGYFIVGCITHHDRREFEIVCLSDTRSRDDMTTRIEALADEWIETADLGRDAFCDRVQQADIDILIDLSGHFRHNRLPEFARRLAPVQATWAGYVGTTGVTAMDWLIADHVHAPDAYGDCATECVARLPSNYVCYTPPETLPDVAPLPADTGDHVTFGCFNNFAKVNDAVLAVWAKILSALPNSTLFLKSVSLDQPDIQDHVISMMADLGIEKQRLILEGAAPHFELLDAYNKVDIALDPFPYSGGLTTLEALLMGVPVVTKTGATFAGRHSTSHLNAVGLTDWIALDEDSYVQLAVSKAQDQDALRSLRLTLRPRFLASSICNAEEFTPTLERAFKDMWKHTTHSETTPRIVDIAP